MMFRLLIILVIVWGALPSLALAMDDTPAANAPVAQNNYVFAVKDAMPTIADALVKAGTSETVKIHVNGVSEENVLANAYAPVSAEIDGLDLDKAHHHWQLTLLLKTGDKNLPPVKLAGRYDEMTTLPVLKRTVQAGEVISMDDIEWSEQPGTGVRKNTITDASQLVGKSPKRVISQNRPVRLDEIASPALINKGSRITLLYKSNNLEIKTLGEAMDSGAKGDVIRVKNVASKSVIEGTVENGNIVRITAPESTSAEAM